MNPASSKVSKDVLSSYITSYSSRVMPGLLNILNKVFIKRFNTDVISLFLEDPSKVYDTLIEVYKDKDTAIIIIAYLIVKPILIKLERLDLLDRAMTLAINDPEEFKKLLKSLNVDV